MSRKILPLARGLVSGLLAAAALAGFNRLADEASAAPADPFDIGTRERYPWRLGGVSYRVAGPKGGTPMLFVHGVHAAASAYEFHKQFPFFAAQGYRVYAPDLLGFGLSDHPAISYDDEIYIALIADFLRDVIGGAADTVVMASSLGCSFAIAAAARYPDRVGQLVLIGPVGLQRLKGRWPVVGAAFYRFVQSPLLGEAFFNALASGPSLRYFLKQQGYLFPENITDAVVQQYFDVSHQPNARFAPGAFVSGALNRDIRDEWQSLTMPILLVWGYQAETVPVQDGAEFLRLNPRAVTNGYDANLLPHDEQAERFNQDTLVWLQGRRKD